MTNFHYYLLPSIREPSRGCITPTRDSGLLVARLGARLVSSGWPILTNLASQSPSLYPATIRSNNSDVETPGVLRVGIKCPGDGIHQCREPALRNLTRTCHLNVVVDVVATITTLVRIIIMGNVINLVLIDESLVDHPRRVWDDLVNPPTVTNGFAPFGMAHDRSRLVFAAEFVRTDSHHEVD